jgi:peptide/nickel transport system permease protein
VTIIVSVPIGILAAVKQYSWTDKIITSFATIGYAIPSFLLAIYVWYIGGIILRDLTGTLFGFEFGFPLFGRQSLGSDGDPLDIAFHLVLPVTALAIQSIAAFSRYLRASMLDVMRQDYVRTARAKGASSSRVIGRHALRNALIPLITLIGLSIPGLIAGAVITEFIFSYPGIGQLTITAIFQNDYPTIYATSMLVGIFVIAGNLVADILYGVVDPRIKY